MSQMALASLKTQLHNLLESMFDEGVVDNEFNNIRTLQDSNINPNLMDEVITSFCSDLERIITELNKYLGYQNVDFSKLTFRAHNLKGTSSVIGAKRLTLASLNLHQASLNRDKEKCIQFLNLITHEYNIVRNKFQSMMQLEKRIIALETNQQ